MPLIYDISYAVSGAENLLVLILFISFNYAHTGMVNRRFRFFLFAAFAMVILDIGTVFTNSYYKTTPVWLSHLINTLYFFACAATAILFLYYSISLLLRDTSVKFRRNLYIANLSFFVVYTVALILNIPLRFFFSVVEGEGYIHGDAYIGLHSATILYLIESIVFFIVCHRKVRPIQKGAAALFFILFIVSFVLQLTVFKDVLLSDFGAAIGALIIFFSLESPDYIRLMATLKELNDLKESLEDQVEERTQELEKERTSYKMLTMDTLMALARLVDAKDHYTKGHSFRVASYSRSLALELGLTQEDALQIYFAGLAHDVGKVGILETILRKKGKLTPEEFEVIKSHTSIGGDILKGMNRFPIFERVARYHHEHYDGSGYPSGLMGKDIPLCARIVAVADAYDAMTSDRSYRKALSEDVAREEIVKGKGTQFDPDIADAFLRLMDRHGAKWRIQADKPAEIA